MKNDQDNSEQKKKLLIALTDCFDMWAVAITVLIAPKFYALTKPLMTTLFISLYGFEYLSLLMLLWGAICAGLVLFNIRVLITSMLMVVSDKPTISDSKVALNQVETE